MIYIIISIASGKGGTGKTTVATNLALCIPNAQLLDCDVEEPDSHIFLDMDVQKVEDVYLSVPIIDKKECNFCQKCSKFCQYHAIAVLPSDVLIFPLLCHGCGGCTLVCPEGAVTEKKRIIGIIEGGISDGIEFYHGILNIGEAMATPVIKMLKRKITRGKNTILDSPPGTSCPAVETIRGSDFCLLVTEPTPFGLYDLKLAIEVVKHLTIPFGVVINRDGTGNDRVEKFCRESKIPVLMRIPHNEDIARLYSDGQPFILEMPEWKEEFVRLFELIHGGGIG